MNFEEKQAIAQKSRYFNYDLLESASKFQYKCQSTSLLYKYFTSPVADKLVTYIPKTVAPNLLTLISLIVNLVTFIAILVSTGNNFSKEVPRSICLLQAITQTLYFFLDNLDGKQARRTQTSSSLGLLLDHGCDAITACILSINLSHIFQLGNGLLGYYLFFSTVFAFWLCTYEEYRVGYLSLGLINGADEGNFMVIVLSLISFIFGANVWQYEFLGIKIVYFLLFISVCGIVFQIVSTIKNLIDFQKNLMIIVVCLHDSWLVFAILFLPIISYIIIGYEYYSLFTTIILFITSIMVSRVIIQLQCNIVTGKKHRNRFIFVFIGYCSVIIFLFSVALLKEKIIPFSIYILTAIFILVLVNFVCFIYDIITSFTGFLGIKLLTINQPPIQVNNTGTGDNTV